MKIIFSQYFSVHFGNSIYCSRSLHRDIRSRIPRRIGAKSPYCTRHKNPQLVLFSKFDDIVHSFDIDTHSEGNVLFSDGTKKSWKMDQPVYSVVDYRFLEPLEVQDIREYVRATVEDLAARFDDVRKDDVFLSVFGSQQFGALDTQLTQTTWKNMICA